MRVIYSGIPVFTISNIAWAKSDDEEMYRFLRDEGIEGIEIAPTRLFPEDPYIHLREAMDFRRRLYEKYGLSISSLQSIWYGRKENIWADENQREALMDYSKRAVEFANTLGCRNLVFGCPKNRNVGENKDAEVELDFFRRLGEVAISFDTVFAIEANPVIYGTNYLNSTDEAYQLIKRITSDGIRLNYDLGTVKYNQERVETIVEMCGYINHVHISEPGLSVIHFDESQDRLFTGLAVGNYRRYVSLEIKNQCNLYVVKSCVRQMKRVAEEECIVTKS